VTRHAHGVRVTTDEVVGLDGHTAEELQQALEASERWRVEAARRNVNAFIEYAGRHKDRQRPDGTKIEDWERLVQYPMHEQFQYRLERYRFLVLMAAPEAGKTTNIVLRLVWLLGHNHNFQFALGSKTAKPGSTAAKMARQIKQYIRYSPEVRRVFPELKPGPKWEETTFMVQRPSYSGDPTVQIFGAFGTLTGTRVDGIVLDDLYNAENTKTEHERVSLLKWIRGSLVDRLSANGFMWISCNAWHPRDPAHELEKDPTSAFVVCRFPVHDPVTGENLLPAIWPDERLATQRAAMGDLEYVRAFELKARDDGESPFREDDVEGAFDEACEAVYELGAADFDPRMHVVASIDPAHTDGPKANWTAITVMAFWDDDLVRQLFWVVAGKWQPDHTAAVILDIQQRFHPEIFVVENNGAQRWMKQIVDLYVENMKLKAKVEGTTISFELPNVLPMMTGKKKHDPVVGVESLSVELSANRWVFPDYRVDGPCQADLVRLRDNILFYVRGAHTGDHLMALHLGREGCRFLGFKNRDRAADGDQRPRDDADGDDTEQTPTSRVPVTLDDDGLA
jgi:hypothetical protein